MGNQESSFEFENDAASTLRKTRDPADLLKRQLDNIEQTLQDIEASHIASLAELTQKKPNIQTNTARIFGAVVECNSSTAVLLGPVVGRVTASTAVILVEVDAAGPVAVVLARTDRPGAPPPPPPPSAGDEEEEGGGGGGAGVAEAARVTKHLQARRPAAFAVAGLAAGARYAAVLSGVRRADAQQCVAHFWTAGGSGGGGGLRALVFGGPDRPAALPSGEPSMWEVAAERIEAFTPVGMAATPGSVEYEKTDMSLRPQLGLHLGGTTWMKEAFEEAWAVLSATAARTDLRPGEYREAEEQARERLAAAYRLAWGRAGKRGVLSGLGNLAVAADADVYPRWWARPELAGEKGAVGAGAALLRLARGVAFEYVHQLNGAAPEVEAGSWRGPHEEVDELTYRGREASRRRKALRANLKKAKKALAELAAGDPAELLAGGGGGGGGEEGGSGGGGVADRLAAAERRVAALRLAVDAAAAEEEEVEAELGKIQAGHDKHLWSYHTFPDSGGPVGAFVLDTVWTRCRADGLLDPRQPIVHESQIRALEDILNKDSNLRQLLVLTSTPLAPALPALANQKGMPQGASRPGTEETAREEAAAAAASLDPWTHSGPQRARLLEALCRWQAAEPWREVLVLTADSGAGCPIQTKIYDVTRGMFVRQIIAGPIAEQDTIQSLGLAVLQESVPQVHSGKEQDAKCNRKNRPRIMRFDVPRAFDAEYTGWIDGNGRFSYEHEPVAARGGGARGRRTYLELALAAGRPGDPRPAASACHFQDAFSDGVRVALGPVVGRVTSTTAVVLLEVDHTAAVTCVVTESLGGRVHRQTRRLRRLRPTAFRFLGLQPRRHHTLRLEGVEDAGGRTGGFTTPGGAAAAPARGCRVAFVSHPPPRPLPPGMEDELSGVDFDLGYLTSKTDGLEKLADTLAQAWSPIDMVVHLGNQVMLDTAMGEVRAMLVAAEGAGAGAFRKTMEAEAAHRVRDGYRTWWNLPALRRLLAHQGHLMLCGEGEVGGASLQGGDDIYAASPYVQATARRLLREAWEDYGRQLWEPAEEREPSAIDNRGGGYAAGQHHARFLLDGGGGGGGTGVALFALDLKDGLLSPPSRAGANWGGEPAPAPLLGEGQWRALGATLARPELRVLLIASEFPLVDDSISDAVFKAESPEHRSLRARWPWHGAELLKLCAALLRWQAHVPGRQIKFVSGNSGAGFRSIIKHSDIKSEIEQLVTGPSLSKVEHFLFEKTGELSKNITYEHSRVLMHRNFLVLSIHQHGGTQEYSLDVSFHSSKDPEHWGLADMKPDSPEWAIKLIDMHLADVMELVKKFKDGTHGLPQSDPMVQIRNILIEDQIMTSLRKMFFYMERSKASVFQDLDTFATTLAHQFQDLFFSAEAQEVRLDSVATPPPAPVCLAATQAWLKASPGRALPLLDEAGFLDVAAAACLAARRLRGSLAA